MRMTIEKQAANAGPESAEARPRDRANLLACLHVQAYGCARAGSPFYAALLERIGADVESGGPTWNILGPYSAEPPDAAVALRFLGAVHRLVLEGRARGLTRHYPSVGGDCDPDAAWAALWTLLATPGPALAPYLERPPQTNEVGRAAALVGGFLTIATERNLPLRLPDIPRARDRAEHDGTADRRRPGREGSRRGRPTALRLPGEPGEGRRVPLRLVLDRRHRDLHPALELLLLGLRARPQALAEVRRLRRAGVRAPIVPRAASRGGGFRADELGSEVDVAAAVLPEVGSGVRPRSPRIAAWTPPSALCVGDAKRRHGHCSSRGHKRRRHPHPSSSRSKPGGGTAASLRSLEWLSCSRLR